MPRSTLALIIFVVCCLLAVFTGFKLYRMAQIRGWVPGAKITTYTVTQKAVTKGWRGRDAYVISWKNENIQTPSHNRVFVPYEKWKNIRIGSQVDIARVGNSEEPYLLDDIYVSDGNFVFDIMLLCTELGVACLMGYYFVSGQE